MTTGDLQISLLGQLSVSRNGAPVRLPSSRKVRALMAYLALGNVAARSTLCDLLWEVPNDPRGELRWCLSKIRGVLDAQGQSRVETSNDRIALNVSDCFVDAIAIEQALKLGIDQLGVAQLREVCDLFGGELLEGLQIDGSPRFSGWLLAQRHRFKANQLSVVERLCSQLPQGSDEHYSRLQTWLQLAPFDRRAHEALMQVLVDLGRVPDAEAHLASAIRQFEAEGLNWLPLRESWRAMRAKHASAPQTAMSEADTRPCESQIGASLATPEAQVGALVAQETAASSQRRVSVAVMPFVDKSNDQRGGMADGLAEDIITRLAKLRAFFVIARGTVFALGERNIGPQEAGRILNVDYVISGVVNKDPQRIAVAVELVDTRTGRIQWADAFESGLEGACAVLDRVGDRIVAAVAEEIETSERNRAVLKPSDSLDAWEAYHRGLWHMYRFSGEDNVHAEHFFRKAVELDRTFARAYAGLSFTHFQNAFLHRTNERPAQLDLAYQTAGQSLMADDRDPAAHWAMGRALWLRRQHDESLRELARSVELSPNFSLGHYMLGFVHSQSGDPLAAIDAVGISRSLSPFDPMQFATLATNAIAHVRLGNYEEAVSWALKATARPNAHKHILSIAAHSLAIANRLEEARAFAALVRKETPQYGVDDFLTAFHFDNETESLFRRGAERIGFT